MEFECMEDHQVRFDGEPSKIKGPLLGERSISLRFFSAFIAAHLCDEVLTPSPFNSSTSLPSANLSFIIFWATTTIVSLKEKKRANYIHYLSPQFKLLCKGTMQTLPNLRGSTSPSHRRRHKYQLTCSTT